MIKWSHVGHRQTAQPLGELLVGDSQLDGDLLVGGSAFELVTQLGDGLLDLSSLVADGSWHPVLSAQSVEDRPLDARHRERLELPAERGIEPIHGIHQSEHAGAHQLSGVHSGGQSGGHTTGHELHERRIMNDQLITGSFVALLDPTHPGAFDRRRRATRLLVGFGHRSRSGFVRVGHPRESGPGMSVRVHRP